MSQYRAIFSDKSHLVKIIYKIFFFTYSIP